MCDAGGTVSSWQSAGQRLQAAVLRLAESGLLPVDAVIDEQAPPAAPGSTTTDTQLADAARALAWYRKLLQGTLSAYSTTTAMDRTALGLVPGAEDAAPMPARTRLAVQFRLAQKAMLNQAVAAAVKGGAAGVLDASARLAFEILGAEVYEEALAEPGAVQTMSGLIIQTEVEGSGAQPTTADTVEVHYEGRNADGIAFDSSYKRGEPTSFPVTGVIAGWTEGLQVRATDAIASVSISPPHTHTTAHCVCLRVYV